MKIITAEMEEPCEEQIILQPFLQRLSAWPNEDWSGITDPKTRRRLQNRVNQRVRRKSNCTLSASKYHFNQIHNTGLGKKRVSHSSKDNEDEGANESSTGQQQILPTVAAAFQNNEQAWATRTTIDVTSPMSLEEIESVHILELDSITTKMAMERLESIARQCYTLGSPRTDLLLHLIQFNFTRALMENTRVLGFTSDQLHDDAISPFSTPGALPFDFERSLPLNLQPTMMQRSTPHHPWLDLLPDPHMRDNLIRAGDFEEETQLCLDMKGHGSTHTGRAGIIVWSDPWDPAGWEITESFARSWGWVIRDCHGLAHSTNRWRAKRNERPLFRID